MLDLVVDEGKAQGIITRNLVTGELTAHEADAVLLCTGGYGNAYYLSTYARGSNVTASWRAHRRGALFSNPCFTQIHPTCIPVSGEYQSKLTLMSESLRNDGRCWVPKGAGDKRSAGQIPEGERDYFLERLYPSYGNLAPRDIASRAAKRVCDEGRGVGPSGLGVYLDFSEAIGRLGESTVKERYANLFSMYHEITGESAYESPMRIYPAVHYTMGGVWVDYNLQSTIPGCFVAGEANFSDHGANRLGASALMQGLADGYFVLPYTVSNYLADEIRTGKISTETQEFIDAENRVKDSIDKFLNNKGSKSVDHFHKRLGLIMWNKVGMGRNEAGLKEAIAEITALKEEFYKEVNVPGSANEFNPQLEKALRVADFIDLGQLMAMDALQRNESCGGHFREEYQDSEGETLRDDKNFSFVGAWEYKGNDISQEVLHKEELKYEFIKIAARNYK